MDATRITGIRDAVALNYDETCAMLDGLAPEDLQRRAANGWTVAQLAGHVAVSPSSALYVLKRLRDGRNATVPAFLSWAPALRNWFIVRKYNRATTADMRTTAGAARDELLAWVATVQDGDLEKGGEVFGSGRQTVGSFLDYVLTHGREHRAEIAAALDPPAA